MGLYYSKVILWGKGGGGLFLGQNMLWVWKEYVICWTYKLGKKLMVKVKNKSLTFNFQKNDQNSLKLAPKKLYHEGNFFSKI